MKRYTVEVYERYPGGSGRKLRGLCIFSQVLANNKQDAADAVIDALIGQRVGDYTEAWPIDYEHEPKARKEGAAWCIWADDMTDHIINEHDFERISIKAHIEK